MTYECTRTSLLPPSSSPPLMAYARREGGGTEEAPTTSEGGRGRTQKRRRRTNEEEASSSSQTRARSFFSPRRRSYSRGVASSSSSSSSVAAAAGIKRGKATAFAVELRVFLCRRRERPPVPSSHNTSLPFPLFSGGEKKTVEKHEALGGKCHSFLAAIRSLLFRIVSGGVMMEQSAFETRSAGNISESRHQG